MYKYFQNIEKARWKIVLIGERYWFTDYPNGMATGSYNTYSIGSGTYYGKEYQRGKFIETYIKS